MFGNTALALAWTLDRSSRVQSDGPYYLKSHARHFGRVVGKRRSPTVRHQGTGGGFSAHRPFRKMFFTGVNSLKFSPYYAQNRLRPERRCKRQTYRYVFLVFKCVVTLGGQNGVPKVSGKTFVKLTSFEVRAMIVMYNLDFQGHFSLFFFQLFSLRFLRFDPPRAAVRSSGQATVYSCITLS